MQLGAFPVTVLILTLACNDGGGGNETDADTDADSDADSDSDTDTDTAEDLVPDEYKGLWDTDGCETEGGSDGASVYWYATEGRSEEDGSFHITERWYWFYEDPSRNCVDTFTVEGEFVAFDYGQLACTTCDEGYEVVRELTEDTCSKSYYKLFDLEKKPLEESYDVIVLLDTMTPSGNPNEENKIQVVNATHVGDNTYAVWGQFARGHIAPDGEDVFGPPASYDWLGNTCVGI